MKLKTKYMALKNLNIILFLLCMMVFASGGSASAFESKKIKGKVVKVDCKRNMIYVMHDSRIVRFYGGKDFCQKRKKVNYTAIIEYQKCKSKGLCALSIEEVCENGNSHCSDLEEGIVFLSD